MKNILTNLFFLIICSFTSIGQSYEKNELLIQIEPNVSIRQLANKMIELGGSELEFFRPISDPMRIYHLKFNQDVDLDIVIRSSFEIKEIIKIQKNHLIEERVTIPNDTDFGDQWYLNNTGQTGGTVDADIDAPEAWDITTGGNTSHGDTIVVCIIESNGVDIDHVDLIDNMWKNYAEIPNNGIDDDNNGYVDDFDGWHVGNNTGVITAGSHGTRVAGMIGAIGNNATGISGVNHQVKMMVVQGQSASSEASVISAYTYPLVMRQKYNQTNGAEGAFVVATNASWGINNGNPANSPLWCAFYDTLGLNGILNIGATSNSNVNVDVVGDLPTACPSEYLVAVTMTNSADFRAGSGYGPIHIDLAAPGGSVLLTNTNDTYSTTSGTSFATPCVAGAVALLYSSPCTDFISYAKTYPDSAALKIRELLLDNVDNLSNLVGEVGSGGRLNINNSLQAMVNSCDTNACLTPYGVSLSDIADTSVTVNWQSNGNSGFDIKWVVSGSSTGTGTSINSSSANSYMITNLMPCVTYEITIQGFCGADTSATSSVFIVRTDGCCENPELEIGNTTETSIDMSWSPILYATDYVIRYQETGTSGWMSDTISSTNTLISNLDTCTDYDIQIKTICGDSSELYSNTYIVRTKGCGICYEGDYCEILPSAVNSTDEWLASFTINGTTSTSGNNNGYFSGGSFGSGFVPGAAYNISFTPGYSGTNFTERYKLWIDMDQNGVFDTSDELISNISGVGIVSGMLFIPSTTISGITKMRIAMNGTGAPTICADEGGNIYGEYEDYCVFVGDNTTVSEFSTRKPTLFPNPSSGLVSILTDDIIESISIFDMSGKLVTTINNPIDNQLSIENFESGVYNIQLIVNGKISQQKLIKY